LNLRQIYREVDVLLPFCRGQTHVGHVVQKLFHAVVVAAEIVEDTRRCWRWTICSWYCFYTTNRCRRI